jgi:hypothetical protein
MQQLDVVCDLGIGFNVGSSWMSCTLDIELVSAILVESDFSLTREWFNWNVYLILFSCICITSKSDFVCVIYISLKLRWS